MYKRQSAYRTATVVSPRTNGSGGGKARASQQNDQARKTPMAETDHNYAPLAPAISPLPPDERRSARAAESPPRLGGSQLSPIADRMVSSRPRPSFECIALLLQGGGALGAYQAGVYEALTEAGLDPDWIAGISIGAINGALIAGNTPGTRVDRLRAFWERVTAKPYCDWSDRLFPTKGDATRQWLNQLSASFALIGGAPGFLSLIHI